MLGGRTELEIDPPPKLSWPLEVGKWGVGRALWRSAPPRPLLGFTGAINVSWQVELSEDLATGGGTFRTLRISQKIETVAAGFGGSGQQFGQVFLWYAPDAQRFVKAEGNLKGLSWELARGAPPPAPPAVAARPPDQPRREATPPTAPHGTSGAAPPPWPRRPRPVAAPDRAAGRDIRRSRSDAEASDLQAPRITLSSPLPDARVTEAQLIITGLVTDNVDVVRIQVLVNGVEATPLREIGVTGRGVPVSALAPLKPGPNDARDRRDRQGGERHAAAPDRDPRLSRPRPGALPRPRAPVGRSRDQVVAGAASGAGRAVTGSSRIASARPAATKPMSAAETNAIS